MHRWQLPPKNQNLWAFCWEALLDSCAWQVTLIKSLWLQKCVKLCSCACAQVLKNSTVCKEVSVAIGEKFAFFSFKTFRMEFNFVLLGWPRKKKWEEKIERFAMAAKEKLYSVVLALFLTSMAYETYEIKVLTKIFSCTVLWTKVKVQSFSTAVLSWKHLSLYSGDSVRYNYVLPPALYAGPCSEQQF